MCDLSILLRMKKIIVVFACLLLIGCGGDAPELEAEYPLIPKRQRALRRGTVTGSGLALYGRRKETENETGGLLGGLVGGGGAVAANPLGVNSFLWRATLDTVSFMPLASADPFGGVVITDWYEDPKVAGERFKMNILIMDKQLRADGIKVNLFKQSLDGNGNWHDVKTNADTARSIEDAILTKARELKIHHSEG
jgi:hypothetical protein